MGRVSTLRLLAGLGLLLALVAGLQLVRPGIVLSRYEGDTLHLMDILLRMMDGQKIHEDFLTPLGVLSVAPFLWMMQAGLQGSTALLAGQLLAALLLLPLIAWVAASRLPSALAWALGAYLVVLMTALIDGGTGAYTGLAMSYNRWAWVLAYLAVVPAVLPLEGRAGQLRDGAVIGLAVALLVLVKVTYALALLPAVLLGLLVRRNWRGIGAGLAAGLAVAAVATLWGGMDYWLAYIDNLRSVASSPLRGWAEESIETIISGPAFIIANLALVAAVLVLRQSGAQTEGIVLLALLPGLIYIVAQNYGNDLQWLVLLAVIVLARLPMERMRGAFGLDLRLSALVLAGAVTVMALPAIINLASSNLRHFGADRGSAQAMVPERADMAGLLIGPRRYYNLLGSLALDPEQLGLEALSDKLVSVPLVINGERLALCELAFGVEIVLAETAARLEAAGYAGQRIWSADLFNLLWLYGDFPALRGVAPWSYGGAAGLEDAELVLVPTCARALRIVRDSIAEFERRGLTPVELHRDPLFRLYRLEKMPAAAG